MMSTWVSVTNKFLLLGSPGRLYSAFVRTDFLSQPLVLDWQRDKWQMENQGRQLDSYMYMHFLQVILESFLVPYIYEFTPPPLFHYILIFWFPIKAYLLLMDLLRIKILIFFMFRMVGDKARYERLAKHKMAAAVSQKPQYKDQVSRDPSLVAQMVWLHKSSTKWQYSHIQHFHKILCNRNITVTVISHKNVNQLF